MTIRFTKAWNVYPVDAIVQTLSASEESRLVSLGLASFDLDGDREYEYMAKIKTDENDVIQGLVNPKTGLVTDLGFADQLFYCRCPMIYHGAGTMNNNGAFVLGTALTRTYARAYLYFPANVIGAGVPAGWYYCTFTSTTAGTVFNNVYTTGNVSFPATPTPFVTTGAGAFANALSTAITGFNFNFVGGSMGNNGKLTLEGLGISSGGASVKDLTAHFDSTLFAQYGMTSIQWYSFLTPIKNMGEQIRQTAPRQNTGGQSAGGINTSDTNMTLFNDLSVNRNVNFRFNIASATDYIILLVADITITRID